MRRFALVSGTALALVIVAVGNAAAETRRPEPRHQPKAGYGSSGGFNQHGVSQPRPAPRRRPALESLPRGDVGHGRSDYVGGHGRSGEGDGWLGWRNWYRR
jgi:hypothetical protein